MDKYCKVCGRKLNFEIDNIKKELCSKHEFQLKKYSFPLDNNPRNEYDLNEYEFFSKHIEIKLYDKWQEEIEDRVLIDKEDYDLVKDIRWNKNRNCVTGRINNKDIPLQNYILNTDEKINFVSQDTFDCRKNNLYIQKRKEKKWKHYNVSKKNKDKIIIDFVGKSKSQVTGSAIVISYQTEPNKYERLLIEFGQSQTNKDLYTEYKSNEEVVSCVCGINNLTACFVLHTHL